MDKRQGYSKEALINYNTIGKATGEINATRIHEVY